MPVGQIPVGVASIWTRTLNRMCGQHNVRASAEDNTGQNTDKGQKLKFLTPRESNPGRRVGRQGLYRPRHGDEYITIQDVKIVERGRRPSLTTHPVL